jgi:hypothetical protein
MLAVITANAALRHVAIVMKASAAPSLFVERLSVAFHRA